MIPYVLAVIFPLFVEEILIMFKSRSNLFYNTARNRHLFDRALFFAALPMFILIAFRNQSIGADTGVYIRHFNLMADAPWSSIFIDTEMEKGYILFVKIITSFTDNPLIYQVICASIYFLSVVNFIKQLEKNQFFVLFLFGTVGMYTFMFTGVRQCLAISICLFSFKYIKNRKIITFIILMVLASLFHKSSVLFVVSYFAYSIRLSYKSVTFYILLMLFSVFNLSEMQQWFNEIMGYDFEIEDGAGGIITSVIVVGMILFSIVFTVRNNKLTRHVEGTISIGIIAAIFWILRLFNRVAERPSFYFTMFVYASFSYAMASLNSYKDRVLFKWLVFFFALALFVYRLSTSKASFIPYRFYIF